jgi:hypothetical protein
MSTLPAVSAKRRMSTELQIAGAAQRLECGRAVTRCSERLDKGRKGALFTMLCWQLDFGSGLGTTRRSTRGVPMAANTRSS